MIAKEMNEKLPPAMMACKKSHNYKMGEEIANGVRFWRNVNSKPVKGNTRSKAECLCPVCDKKWVVIISDVKNGNTKSCCGRGKDSKKCLK